MTVWFQSVQKIINKHKICEVVGRPLNCNKNKTMNMCASDLCNSSNFLVETLLHTRLCVSF